MRASLVMARIIGGLAFQFLLVTTAFTQYPRIGAPEILNFSNSDYSAGTQNWSIVQDASGIVYFGNNKGLLQYDGVYWNHLPMPNQTIVRSLAQSTDGRIYVGGQDELGYLSLLPTGLMSYHSLVELIPTEDRSFEDVWKIFPQDDGVFFCARGAVFILRGDSCVVVRHRPQGSFENYFLVNERIFGQVVGVGLTEWDGTQFTLVPGGAQFGGSRLAAILPHDNDLLIVSDFRGLFLMTAAGIESWQTESSAFLGANQPYCALLLPDSTYAIGTAQNGLLIMDKAGHGQLLLDKNSGLQNNTILSLFMDRQQNFWLGLDNGIDYVKVSAPFTLIGSESGIEGTGYCSYIHNDRLYLGTNQGLFSMEWPGNKSVFESNPFKRVENLTGQIWHLGVVADELIVSSHEGLYSVIDTVATPLGPVHGSWKFEVLDAHPEYAIEGTYTGLRLYQKKDNKEDTSWTYTGKISGLDESARVLEQDDDGSIWVSHYYKGLYRLRLGADDLLSAEVTRYDSKDGFASDLGINVARIKGEVIFTTPRGVYQYDSTEDNFIPYTGFNSLLGGERNIYRLVEDAIGQLWISFDDHFGVFNMKDKGFFAGVEIDKRFFDHLQGDLVDGFEDIYAYDEHNVFIATEKGFVHYDAAALDRRDLSFNVLIRTVTSTAGMDSLIFGDAGQTRATPEPLLKLPNALNSLEFTYAAPFFEHIGQIHYRYRLKGFDDTFSEWTMQTRKEFTNLPYGEYTFIVEARNAFGDISVPREFDFVIEPPWYQSTTAWVCYSAGAILLIFYFYSASQRRVEREKASLVKEQAKTLAEKEAEFREVIEQSDAEVIRLRNENLQADVQHKTAELASATMHLVQKGEMLLSIKRDLNTLLRSASPENKRKLQHLIHSLDDDIRLDNTWEQFEKNFDLVHGNFLQNIRAAFPDLTPKDQKLCAYLRMNLTTKEIAPLMNISVRGVEISRYRLRKKLGIDTETNLTDFIMRL